MSVMASLTFTPSVDLILGTSPTLFLAVCVFIPCLVSRLHLSYLAFHSTLHGVGHPALLMVCPGIWLLYAPTPSVTPLCWAYQLS